VNYVFENAMTALREEDHLFVPLRRAMSEMNGVETLQQTALQLKERGNADFKAGHFDKAIEHYSRAIGTTPSRSRHRV